MYYYIFEPVKQSYQRKLQEKVKRLVLNLGISGEIVSSSPARTINDLVDIALTKGFTTVVCVGNDLFINKVLSALLLKVDLSDSKIAFGIVPLDYKDSFFAKKLKYQTPEDACQCLRYRNLKSWDVGFINPSKFFLSPLMARTENPVTLKIILPDYELMSSFTKLSINTDLIVNWIDESIDNNLFSRIRKYLFNQNIINTNVSKIYCQTVKIITDPSIPIYLESEIIAKTPIQVKVFRDYLQVIVNRDNIASSERKD